LRGFLEYLRTNAGTKNFQHTMKQFFLWIIFLAIVFAVYWNAISYVTAQVNKKQAEATIVKHYSEQELRDNALSSPVAGSISVVYSDTANGAGAQPDSSTSPEPMVTVTIQ
jgi:predicted membrane protein